MTRSSSRLWGRHRRDWYALLRFEYRLIYSTLFAVFKAECGLAANSFLSVLCWRGVSKLKLICYQLTGEFWIDSTAWDLYSLYRLLRKLKINSKLFIMKLFFEEFNLLFFTAEGMACFDMQPRWRRLGEFWGACLLYGQGNLVFKRKKLMYL